MSKEIIINTIRQDFKGKAWDYNTMQCLYKTDCGKKCAVGLFIPDGHEAQSSKDDAEYILNHYPDLMDAMPSKDIDFWEDFQRKHDGLDVTLDVTEQQDILIDWVENSYGRQRYCHEE